MANRLISVGNHLFTDAVWLVADASASSPIDSESSTVAITTSTSTHISPNFTPGGITVDGIAIKISSRAASPTGTFTVVLRNTSLSSDVISVVVNVADLKLNGWHYFKFSSPQVLTPAITYAVRLTCSVSSEVTVYRVSSQNFSKFIVTTTTAAPTTGDAFHVMNALTGQGASTSSTVTFDNTASTVFGDYAATYVDSFTVSGGGTLTWGTTASTNYLLTIKGRITVWDGSTWNMGTSGGRMPASSTAKIAFTVSTNVDSAFWAWPGAIVNIYGATKTNWTYLNTDEAAGQTVLGVVDTTGWAANDVVCIASTTRTYTQAESRTISTVDSVTQVTVSSGLTNAHSGTAPTRAEVGNLTRNISIYGTSTSLQAYVRFDTTAVVNIDSCEFYWMGSNTTNKRGVNLGTITGTCNLVGCSFHDFLVSSSTIISTDTAFSNTTIQNCVFFLIYNGITIGNTTGTWTIDGCLIIGGSSSLATAVAPVTLTDAGGIFTNNTIANAKYIGVVITDSDIGTFSGNTIHSGSDEGLRIAGAPGQSISNCTIYRNNGGSGGIVLSGYGGQAGFTIDSCTIFGNPNNLSLVGSGSMAGIIVKNCVIAGDSTFSSAIGIRIVDTFDVIIQDCTMGVTSGIFTSHTSGDVEPPRFGIIIYRNCIFGSSTEIILISNNFNTSTIDSLAVLSQQHDQTAGLHKIWRPFGVISTDTVTYRTSSPSIAMTPNSASIKLRATLPGRHFEVPVDSGQSVTFTCYVQKSASYNGNQPRLLLLSNSAIGITSDTVLATASGGTGSWLQLQGTTSAANANGIMEFTVDCDGTAGVVYISDISCNGSAKDTTSPKYWHDGQPIIMAPAPTGSNTYIINRKRFV